ncbi:MAG: septum formation inhibitor Maf [Rhodanobacteraceae bacterium]|nr:septum formation inhibitor Maf [Rhodanobacteraceae bacterium]
MTAAVKLDAVDLVLGSTSRYRAELLRRLTPVFRQAAPEVDETPLPGEAAPALALRLAQAKACAVAQRFPGAVVIGSDQVAELDGMALGKPGDSARAQAQLIRCSGRAVHFHTGLCLADARSAGIQLYTETDLTTVQFRELAAEEISRYIAREQPLDCAGSFKSEGLGIALFERITSDDPSALIGLPLIALCRLLRLAGIVVL